MKLFTHCSFIKLILADLEGGTIATPPPPLPLTQALWYSLPHCQVKHLNMSPPAPSPLLGAVGWQTCLSSRGNKSEIILPLPSSSPSLFTKSSITHGLYDTKDRSRSKFHSFKKRGKIPHRMVQKL